MAKETMDLSTKDIGEVNAFEVEGVDVGEIDLDNISDTVYELIPRGAYPAEITDVEYGGSQKSGNPMWTLRLRITEGEYKGRTLFNHMVFIPAGLPRVKQFLARVAPDITGKIDPCKIADEGLLEGLPCSVRVGVQRYEGERRNNVREILAPQAGASGFLDS